MKLTRQQLLSIILNIDTVKENYKALEDENGNLDKNTLETLKNNTKSLIEDASLIDKDNITNTKTFYELIANYIVCKNYDDSITEHRIDLIQHLSLLETDIKTLDEIYEQPLQYLLLDENEEPILNDDEADKLKFSFEVEKKVPIIDFVNKRTNEYYTNIINEKLDEKGVNDLFESIKEDLYDQIENEENAYSQDPNDSPEVYDMLSLYYAIKKLQKNLKGNFRTSSGLEALNKINTKIEECLTSKPVYMSPNTFKAYKEAFDGEMVFVGDETNKDINEIEYNFFDRYSVDESNLINNVDEKNNTIFNIDHLKALANHLNMVKFTKEDHMLESRYNSFVNMKLNDRFSKIEDFSLIAIASFIELKNRNFKDENWVNEQLKKFNSINVSKEQLEMIEKIVNNIEQRPIPEEIKVFDIKNDGTIVSDVNKEFIGQYFDVNKDKITTQNLSSSMSKADYAIKESIKTFDEINLEEVPDINSNMIKESPENIYDRFSRATDSIANYTNGNFKNFNDFKESIASANKIKNEYNNLYKDKGFFGKIFTYFSKDAREMRSVINKMDDFFDKSRIDFDVVREYSDDDLEKYYDGYFDVFNENNASNELENPENSYVNYRTTDQELKEVLDGIFDEDPTIYTNDKINGEDSPYIENQKER